MVNLSSEGVTSRGDLSAVANTRRVGVRPKEAVEGPVQGGEGYQCVNGGINTSCICHRFYRGKTWGRRDNYE